MPAIVQYDTEIGHAHECLGETCMGPNGRGTWWVHDDPMCEYPKQYDCPICDRAPTDWVRVDD